MAKPRPIKQLLSAGTVSELLAHAEQLQSLSILLLQCLPADAVGHAQVVRCSEGQLTVQVDSNAWATRLRYLSPQLLRCLQQLPDRPDIRRITLRIAPVAATPAASSARPAHLSAASAQIIGASAQTINDPHLRAALQRLAQRAK